MKQFLALLLFVTCAIPHFINASDADIRNSVCIVSGENGSGSGFFTEIEGQNVVVTNNHVILEIKEAQITDVNGKEYKYDTIYSSPDVDLAIIPVDRDNLDERPNLQLHPSPDQINGNEKVVAYGNSLGAQVIVSQEGHFLGIGPDKIEVDAPFVQGNSGGPVIEKSSEKVIGVATYMTIIRDRDATKQGSRFQPDRFEASVRRFATRVDRIKLGIFEKLTHGDIKDEIEIYASISDLNDEVMAEIKKENFDIENIKKIKRLLSDKNQLTTTHSWKSTYLKKSYEEKSTFLLGIRKILYPDGTPAPQSSVSAPPKSSSFQEEKFMEAWRKHCSALPVKKTPEKSEKCKACNGVGQKLRMDYDESSIQGIMNAKSNAEVCAVCRGNKRVVLYDSIPYVVPPAEFINEVKDCFTAEKQEIFGLIPGKSYSNMKEFAQGAYVKKQYSLMRVGPLSVLRYTGNHHFQQACETRIWLLGNILLRVDIIFPIKNQHDKETIEAQINHSFKDLSCTNIASNILRNIRQAELEIKNESHKSSNHQRQEQGMVSGDPMRGGMDPMRGGIMGGGSGMMDRTNRRVASEQNEESHIRRLKIYRASGRDPFHWYYEPALLEGNVPTHDLVFVPELGRSVVVSYQTPVYDEYPAFLCFSFFHAGFAFCVNLLK